MHLLPTDPSSSTRIVATVYTLLTWTITISLAGCSAGTPAPASSNRPTGPGLNSAPSLFSPRQITLRCVVVSRDQTPFPLVSVVFKGLPASAFKDIRIKAKTAFDDKAYSLRSAIDRIDTRLQDLDKQLQEETTRISKEFNKRNPELRAEKPHRDDPLYLEWIAMYRKERTEAQRWCETQKSRCITPLQEEQRQSEEHKTALTTELAQLNPTAFLWDELQSSTKHTQWTTGKGGEVAIALPDSSEHWFLWGQTSQAFQDSGASYSYQWILDTREVESNGYLLADHNTLLSNRGLISEWGRPYATSLFRK